VRAFFKAALLLDALHRRSRGFFSYRSLVSKR
jgi:hypothetical protein